MIRKAKEDVVALRKAHKLADSILWREYQIIRCRTCSLPFLRKELPKNKRCRPCVKALKEARKLKDPERYRLLQRATKHRRRARKTGAGGNCTPKQWLAIVARFNGRCAFCGVAGEMTRDHIIPLSRGGSDDPLNIQPLCRPCNTAKGDTIAAPIQAFIPGVKSAVS
jgi:5-methylcytosine-specific restriction endonuclease McrA